LKEQLLNFIWELENPFSINFLAERCLQPVRRETIQEILSEFEKEGNVIFIGDGLWITTKTLVDKVLKRRSQTQVPSNLLGEVISFLIKHPELGYSDLKDSVKDAILHIINGGYGKP